MLEKYFLEPLDIHDATQWLWTYNNDRPNMGSGGVTPAMKLNQYKMTE